MNLSGNRKWSSPWIPVIIHLVRRQPQIKTHRCLRKQYQALQASDIPTLVCQASSNIRHHRVRITLRMRVYVLLLSIPAWIILTTLMTSHRPMNGCIPRRMKTQHPPQWRSPGFPGRENNPVQYLTKPTEFSNHNRRIGRRATFAGLDGDEWGRTGVASSATWALDSGLCHFFLLSWLPPEGSCYSQKT